MIGNAGRNTSLLRFPFQSRLRLEKESLTRKIWIFGSHTCADRAFDSKNADLVCVEVCMRWIRRSLPNIGAFVWNSLRHPSELRNEIMSAVIIDVVSWMADSHYHHYHHLIALAFLLPVWSHTLPERVPFPQRIDSLTRANRQSTYWGHSTTRNQRFLLW